MDINQMLPTILQKNNIARIENRKLLIGDRRRYPFALEFVRCSTVGQIGDALKAMVTQGGGPLQVALTTMQFVARQIALNEQEDSLRTFSDASQILSNSRPTNTTMARTLATLLGQIVLWYTCESVKESYNSDLVEFVDQLIETVEKRFDEDYLKMGKLGSTLIDDGDSILTTCFAEHSLFLSLIEAKKEGKEVQLFVPETRPYYQGSRLTAPSLVEIGVKGSVITDTTGISLMREKKITKYMTAADLVTMDGTVVNKVGTLANAIGASYYKIPYTPFAMSPDATKEGVEDIVIEIRDGKEILKNSSVDTLDALYLSFDIVDSSLVDKIVTPKGIFKPDEIKENFGR